MLERYFKLAENQTTVKQECLGGLTTFLTMAYIVVVNPQILAQAGMPVEGVVFATCLSAAVATLVMGALRQLSHRAGAGDVAQRLLHLFRLFEHARSLAHRAGRGFPFRRSFPGAHGYAGARADRQRHARLPEAFDRHRHRVLHRFRGAAECETGGGQCGYICRSGKFRRPRSADRLLRPRPDAVPDGAQGQRRNPDRDRRHCAAGHASRHLQLAVRDRFAASPVIYFSAA